MLGRQPRSQPPARRIQPSSSSLRSPLLSPVATRAALSTVGLAAQQSPSPIAQYAAHLLLAFGEPCAVSQRPRLVVGAEAEILGDPPRPIGIGQRRARDRNQVRCARLQDVLGLLAIDDHADRLREDARFAADRLGKSNLKSEAAGDRKPSGLLGEAA